MIKLKLINTLFIILAISLCTNAQNNFAKDADAAFQNEAYYCAKDQERAHQKNRRTEFKVLDFDN